MQDYTLSMRVEQMQTQKAVTTHCEPLAARVERMLDTLSMNHMLYPRWRVQYGRFLTEELQAFEREVREEYKSGIRTVDYHFHVDGHNVKVTATITKTRKRRKV